MPDFDSQVVHRRLEEFRRNLLDTSLRNRLINFRTQTKKGKPLEKVVEVQGGRPADLIRTLIVAGKAMRFVGRPDPRIPKSQTMTLELQDESDGPVFGGTSEDDEMDAFLRTGVDVADTLDLKLHTNDTVTALQRKLTKISRDAKVAVEEQGVNVLFLALGSLEWFEADDSQEARRAPLVLVPVSLDRTNGGAFRLRWDGTDTGGNLSISAKLKAEFGIRLPELPDEPDVAKYLKDVKRAIASQARWSVLTDTVALAFFSYAKYLMYRDLDSGSWPEKEKPTAHETLGALLDCGFEEDEPGISEEAFLDPLRPCVDVCEVFDTDSSQTLAILEANTGRTMIIEGPPGTGKSQTITNLIAEAIGAGKKVLFVAEKATALDVVYRRLKEANLEDACLELHSHKANKRDFYAELKRTVSIAAPKTARTEADLKRLEESRAQLNEYTQSVNDIIVPFDISPRFAMGRLIVLGPESTPAGRHDFASMEKWSHSVFLDRLETVLRLQHQVSLMGRPVDHPYYGCTLDHLLPQDREDIGQRLSEASDAVDNFEESAKILAEALRVELPVRPADLEDLRVCADFVSQSPEAKGLSVRADWRGMEPSLRSKIAVGKKYSELFCRVQGHIADGAIHRDVAGLRSVLRLGDLTSHAADNRTAEDLKGVLNGLAVAKNEVAGLIDAAKTVASLIGTAVPKRLWESEPLLTLAKRLSSAPDVQGMSVSDPNWSTSASVVQDALGAVRSFLGARARYQNVLTEDAWQAEVQGDLDVLVTQSGHLLRFFNGSFRNAMASTARLFRTPSKSPSERIPALRAIVEARDASDVVGKHRGRLSSLYGDRWCGVQSDLAVLEEAASWIIEAHTGQRVPMDALSSLERGVRQEDLAQSAELLRTRITSVNRAFDALRKSLVEVGINNLEEGTGDANERVLEFVTQVLQPRLAEIEGVIPGSSSRTLCELLGILDDLHGAQEARKRLLNDASEIENLGELWNGTETNWIEAESSLEWVLDLHNSVTKSILPAGLISFFADECPRAGLTTSVRRAQANRQAAQDAVARVLVMAQLDRDPAAFTELPIAQQRDRIGNWKDRLDDLPALIRYNAIESEAKRQGLFQSTKLSSSWDGAAKELAASFERSWYTGVVRQAVRERPILARFERGSHESIAEEFRRLDDLSLKYNRSKVALAHWRSVPRGSAGGAMGWLGVQFNLRQSFKPIRVAMEKAGEAVQAIKPVFLMSPLSVAIYLPSDGPRFDLVIFDEASQVKPEDAFGGILRAKQAIVVGDSKQMPPTSFFEKLTRETADDDEDEEEDDLGGAMKELESVLAMVSAKLPPNSPRRRDLRWHYRSRHDDLIATSNRLFYDDRLVVFPSPWRDGANAGLVLRHDPKTIYGRGGSRKNVDEARAVAEAARRHILDRPRLSLGIAAFSRQQQEAILDELDLLRANEPAFGSFDAAHPFEQLVVKNLETVQGEERDVIFISVGYGRDDKGYIPASFGPLNRDGGERRLNVLITRARLRCEVFTNLKAGDIRFSERPSQGVMALKTFLSFADTGSLDVPSSSGAEPQSPFEEAVLDRLRAAGYDVEPQVGSCGFYIDMAVRHPEQPQRFVLGIECDGAMYHSARSARDRDKLRQQALESRGWRLHRIWSTDWFQNQDREFDRLVSAITSATALTSNEIAEGSAKPSEFVELERDEHSRPIDETGAYVECDIQVEYTGVYLHQAPAYVVANWVEKIVSVESPVHVSEIIRRIREAAYVAKAGSRICAAIEGGIEVARKQKRVIRKGDFLYDPSQISAPVRSRITLPAQLKRLELVSPEEILEALVKVIHSSFGIERDEAIVLAARMLGFERTTSAMIQQIGAVLDRGVRGRRITKASGLLRVDHLDTPVRKLPLS